MPDPRIISPRGFDSHDREVREIDARWFESRREGHRPVAVTRNPVTELPRALLREPGPRDVSSWTPEGAPRSFGTPARDLAGLGRRLRRFNGQRVEPCNFTQIYNSDDRRTYADTNFPWVCIGRIDFPGYIYASAVLVGRSLIVTAAHPFADRWRPGGPLQAGITFTPACYDGVSLLGRDWTANVVNVAAWESTTDVVAYDMAVCQLDQPMGEWLGYLGAITYDDAWEDRSVWAHCGYPYDLGPYPPTPDRPCYQMGIAVFDDDSDDYDTLELETKADIASCQSGGPLFAPFDDGHTRVIGTLAGRTDHWDEEKCSLFAGGNGLVKLISWGREHYD